MIFILNFLFINYYYNVFNYGKEEVLPGTVGSLNSNTSAEAQSIRQLPDFVIQNKEDGSLSYLEVKYRHNGNFKRSELPKDFKYTNAFFIIVHKLGISCISFNDLSEIGHMPNEAPFTLSTQKQFVLSETSISAFVGYAKMLFQGVD